MPKCVFSLDLSSQVFKHVSTVSYTLCGNSALATKDGKALLISQRSNKKTKRFWVSYFLLTYLVFSITSVLCYTAGGTAHGIWPALNNEILSLQLALEAL